ADGGERLGRRVAVPRPLAVDGGLDRGRDVRDALYRRALRARARPRVRGRVRADGPLPDDRRPRVRRQHAGLHVVRRPDDPMGRDGDGLRAPHVPRARAPLGRARRHGRRHEDGRPGGELPDPLEGGGPRDVALPLPRRGAHDGRDDRHLPGAAPMTRKVLLLALALAAVGAPAALAMPDQGPGAMPGEGGAGAAVSILRGSYEPAQIDVLAGDTVTWSNDSVLQHTVTA